MVEIYFLPWLRFCLCAATAACWPALPDRMLPAAYAICLFALLICGDSRVLAGFAGQNASCSMRDLLICSAYARRQPLRENKFPTSQKKTLGI